VQDLIVIEEATIDGLGLHRVEERFHEGIVVELAAPPHALDDAQGSQTGTVCIRGVLDSSIGMKDEPAGHTPAGESSVECFQRQIRISP
jgi:hypothetical protein